MDKGIEMLKKLPDNIIVKMCNELFDWHFSSTGCLEQDGEVRQFARAYFNSDAYQCEKHVWYEAHKRFEKVVKYLFTQNASLYISR